MTVYFAVKQKRSGGDSNAENAFESPLYGFLHGEGVGSISTFGVVVA